MGRLNNPLPCDLNHDALATSLASHLRSKAFLPPRVTWENLSFSDWNAGASLNCRPDVFSIVPTLDVEKARPWTHEIKISRSDFLSDVRSEKWRQYAAFSCRIFFAAPQGMIGLTELPRETGLWEFDGERWRMSKPAMFCKGWSLPSRHLMKLILGRWGTAAHMLPGLAALASNTAREGG